MKIAGLKVPVPNFIVRRVSYNKIMKINEEINKLSQKPDINQMQTIGQMETKKQKYIKKYNSTFVSYKN